MNILKPEKKLAVIAALTEGCSIRSIVRMTGVHKKTIMKLVVEVGTKCEQMMKEKMYGIRCEAVECDEIWTFVGKKEGVMKADERKANPEFGDQYTYVALDPVSKMIPAFHVGKRDSVNTHRFIEDLSHRIEGSTQVSTDAWGPYSPAIARYFGQPCHLCPDYQVLRLGESWPWTVRASACIGNSDHRSLGHPQLQQGLYVLCGAPEFDSADEDCAVSPAHPGVFP